MGQPRAALVDVGERILELRGVRVLIDHDLSSIYGVPTKVFNQAIKRNAARFPPDFAFRLTREEFDTLRSQFVTSKAGRGGRRHLPLAFTEHGGIMAAAVLNSPRAVEMSVFVVRAFVRLRDSARHYAALARQLAALERRVSIHDGDLKQVFAALRQLLEKPARPRRLIGFGDSGA
jgi:hypothetical protein